MYSAGTTKLNVFIAYNKLVLFYPVKKRILDWLVGDPESMHAAYIRQGRVCIYCELTQLSLTV